VTIKEALAGLFNKGDLPPLPDSFMFGVATADHQCEGIDPKYEDIRDWWEKRDDPKQREIRLPTFGIYMKGILTKQKIWGVQHFASQLPGLASSLCRASSTRKLLSTIRS
jgi:hypothetical protein